LRCQFAEHGLDIEVLELDQARFALVGDFLEDIDVGKELVQVVVDALPGVLRQAGQQVDAPLNPAEVVLELVSDGCGDIPDELVPPGDLLVLELGSCSRGAPLRC
jgi:hypothetical protein